MKVALIPPLGWESYLTRSTGVAMALALEETISSVSYMNSFKLLREMTDNIIILDNGAAEGTTAKNSTVVAFGRELNVHEIVLPDVLGSKQQTLEKVGTFFRYLKWNPVLSYMGVVQGDSIGHAKSCIHAYADMLVRRPDSSIEHQPVTTLGIPRRLIKATDNLSARIDLANWILEQYGRRFEIHFLGATGVWAHEIKYAVKYAPQVRSLDTSLPFNFAMMDINLKGIPTGIRSEVLRAPGYMSGRLVNKNPALVQRNIETYLSWAQG